ncbi:hypothetical protein ACFFX0_31130 [Citricoccus parietis]|uniref:Uncharacterized protein n=1 Tax=Citricoccus parietis TaxID=592307 RepID=A0ABV5G8X0_9MICC
MGGSRSTRITSAPRSLNSIAVNGVGPTPANSTTRIPFNGPTITPLLFAAWPTGRKILDFHLRK